MPMDTTQLVAQLRQAQRPNLAIYDADFLARTVTKQMAVAGQSSTAAYLELLAHDAKASATLVAALNVGYSEFFRSPLSFALLEQVVLPRLLTVAGQTGRRGIRVWSAGCAAGQEAYSVALLLEVLTSGRQEPTTVHILATDCNQESLAAARAGVYEAAALQNVPLKYLERGFVRTGDRYAVLPRVRESVEFSAYDLLDAHTAGPPAGIFGDFDLILCCNLLFYYSAAARQVILQKLSRALASDGYLVTGETERASVEQTGAFALIAPPAAVFRNVRQAG